MSIHPQHHHGPDEGLQTLVRLYPSSVLWVLFAVALAVVLTVNWIVTSMIALLVTAVVAHCGHRLHHDRKGPRP